MQVQAYTKYARMSPRKVREVTQAIQGRNAAEAVEVLRFIPRKSARLVSKTLQSAIANAENNNKRKYFRILKSFDVTLEEGKVENILKEVFNNLAMKAVVEKQPVEDSDVEAWIENLRKLPNLHFES